MKPFVRIALPFLALGALASCGDGPDALFQRAKQEFAVENYRQARVDLSAALRKRPEDRAMLELLVETQLRLGDPDGADSAMARLERVGGKGAVPARMRAEAALLHQDPKQALALLGNDASPQGWQVRAEALLALGQEGAARAAYDKGLAAGGDVRLGASYARYLLLDGDLYQAAKVVQRMQAIAPGAYETLVAAGDLASAQGRDDAAGAAYRKVVEAYPDRIAPMLALADHYDEMGNLDEATKLVEQAGKVAPDAPEVEEMRIQLLSEKGDWEAIRSALQSRESDLAAGSTLSMSYGEALLRLGHPEQARAIFRRAVLVLPGNPYSRMMLGEAQLATGDATGAWATLAPLAASTLARPEVLERAAKAARGAGAPQADALQARLDPARLKATMALVDQGEGALERRDWAQAVAVYTQLLARGDDPEVLKRLALAKSGLGDGAAAVALADRAVALDRSNPDYLYTAGTVRLAAGKDAGEARRLLEAAASADPRNQAIARELRKAKAATG
jgi:predicted Zn-dependent protease